MPECWRKKRFFFFNTWGSFKDAGDWVFVTHTLSLKVHIQFWQGVANTRWSTCNCQNAEKFNKIQFSHKLLAKKFNFPAVIWKFQCDEIQNEFSFSIPSEISLPSIRYNVRGKKKKFMKIKGKNAEILMHARTRTARKTISFSSETNRRTKANEIQ